MAPVSRTRYRQTAEPTNALPGTVLESHVIFEARGFDGDGVAPCLANPPFSPLSVSGNILSNDLFGADGPGNPPLLSIEYLGGELGDAVRTEGPGTLTFTHVGGVWEVVILTDGPNIGDYTFSQFDNFIHASGQGENFADARTNSYFLMKMKIQS